MKGKGRRKKRISLILAAVLLLQSTVVQATMEGNGGPDGQPAVVEAATISENQAEEDLNGSLGEDNREIPEQAEALEEDGGPEVAEESVEGEAVSGNRTGTSSDELVEEKSPFEADRYNPEYYNAVVDRYPSAKQVESLYLTERNPSFENYILNAVANFQSKVDVSAYEIPKKDMWTEIYHVLNNHPELFYVTVTTVYMNRYTGNVDSYMLNYIGTQSTIEAEKAKFIGEAQKALAYVSDDMTEYEKALAVHDYIILNCEYDEESLEGGLMSGQAHTAYGALVKKLAVCDGYAKAYQYIMKELLGIPCQVVSSSEMSHAWSLIKIDGKWYHADLTWDDPLYDCIGRVCHQFFLLSDSTMSDMEHEHHDWQVKDENKQDIRATDEKYADYKWIDVYSGMFYEAGNWYYVNAYDSSIVKDDDLSTADESLVFSIDNEGNQTWRNRGSARIMLLQDRIYFNTPSLIKSVDLDGGNERTEKTVKKAEDESIYGFIIQNNNFKYTLLNNAAQKVDMLEVRTDGVPEVSVLSVGAKDYNSLDITLSRVEKAENATESGYVIYRKAAWETKWKKAAFLEGAGNTYFRDSGLGDEIEYIYAARNYQVINGDICYGPFSNQVSAVTMKAKVIQPNPGPSPAPSPAPKDTAEKGKVYSCGNYKYQVTAVANGKTGKVTLKAPKKKTYTKVTVPATVKIKGENYQVTAIDKNAFKNNKQLKSVTIGKYVTKIGANAFYGCKKLKTVSIKTTKLKSVGKSAFKGIVKSATVKVPKSKLAAYKKLLKKKTTGLPAKAKIKKG